MNFVKFLRAPFSQSTSWRLLLLTVHADYKKYLDISQDFKMIRETYNIPIITNSIVEIEALDTRTFSLH